MITWNAAVIAKNAGVERCEADSRPACAACLIGAAFLFLLSPAPAQYPSILKQSSILRIPTSRAQDQKARNLGDKWHNDPGTYRVLSENCSDKAAKMIAAAVGGTWDQALTTPEGLIRDIQHFLRAGETPSDKHDKIYRALYRGNCFLEGTLVRMASGELRAIETLKAGERVTAFNHIEQRVVIAGISRVSTHWTPSHYVLHVEGGALRVTQEHPVFVIGMGYVEVRDLRSGMKLQTLDGSSVQLESIESVVSNDRVWNISVEDAHNYFVGGSSILVHNK